MSDEDQSNVNSEEQQQDDQQNSQEEDDQQQDDQQDQDDQDQDQQGSGDQDDQDGSGEDQDQDEDQQDASKQQESEEDKKLPTFKMVARQPPEQFKFTSLLSQISSLSHSVDNFIGTLNSTNTTFIKRPLTNYAVQQTTYKPRLEEIKVDIPAQSRVVIMKDQDTQVDMKPQIIIQPTKAVKQDPILQAKPYKISTQSQKFLAQLYEQNKKLKRWQTNTNHPMNSYMTSFSGSNGFQGNVSKPFYASKDKFQRKQYQKGLFNVQERNKQIDEAILMLKRQEQQQY